ncbi:hypothetical protein [Blastococcus sp. CT_GayMR19]|uniref:hypothetical protein n=1 Tax=Blastococcus sp. CT_GayMR19 TaxID=2559608 RepID=UPI00142F3DE7|nr:hypothetical protein [Blastococcus sp. CT_GayMR19]
MTVLLDCAATRDWEWLLLPRVLDDRRRIRGCASTVRGALPDMQKIRGRNLAPGDFHEPPSTFLRRPARPVDDLSRMSIWRLDTVIASTTS